METKINIDAIPDSSIGKDKLSEDTQSQLEKINEIDGKQDKLISGNNIKTINGASILGEGDITISVDEELTEILDRVSENEKVTALALNELKENEKLLVEEEKTRATEAEAEIKSRAIDSDSVNIEAETEDVRIDFATLDDGAHSGNITIPAATTEKAGVMTAEDKVNLANSTVIKVTWDSSSYMNNFTTAGVYSIKGTRTNLSDNLPITNTGENATIAAKLFVTVTPEGATTYRNIIGQTLILSNAQGFETKVYTRSAFCSSYDGVTYQIEEWTAWKELQSNQSVGVLASLDDLNNFTDNGIYSGVINLEELTETFVMIVINDYALGVSPRRISQFRYSLVKASGAVNYLSRSGYGDDAITWGDWEITNNDAIYSMISNEIKKVTDGVDPEKLDLLKDLIDWVDTHGGEIIGIKNDIQALAAAIEAETERAVEEEGKLEENIAKEKKALVNGDTIVGLAREVYSRQGKVDSATFLKRTTAGGTSVSDGVATLKQIGGNIVKNYVDASFIGNETLGVVNGHIYYFSTSLFNGQLHFDETSTDIYSGWKQHSIISKATSNSITIAIEGDNALNTLLIDLTEMFGKDKEPTAEECDRMFSTMGALPQGLTVAQPIGLKSTGYNQWKPENVLINKTITDNAIVDGDKNIAIVECLPCKTGAGENNGYVIGYGEGDDWSDEGVEVYLSPLNPLDVGNGAELYMHKLEKDSTYGTYVPLIKGCLLVVTPTTDKLCAHLHWSGDREITDYEEYVESNVALPTIPEMSEWGLAGISTSGTMVQDTIDLENMVYTKRLTKLKLNNVQWTYYSANDTYPFGFFVGIIGGIKLSAVRNILPSTKYTTGSNFTVDKTVFGNIASNGKTIYIVDSEYNNREALNANLADVDFYAEIVPEEYPIVTKTAPNYISSDYGVEEFTDSEVPLAANILFYMRSLVSETRNFLDRLMARLGISDATAVADKIADAIIPTTEETEVEPTTVIEE